MFNSTASRDETAAPRADSITIEKILVVVDPTAVEHPCVEKAARIAARLGSSIELYICDDVQSLPDSWAGTSKQAEYRELRRQRFAEALVDLATPLRARGLIVTTLCEWGVPLEKGIGEHVVRTRPDLVIKDTHRHRLPTRGPVTSTDLRLISQIPAPLLLVRPAAWAAQPRIVAAIDPCHPADRPESLDQRLISTGCLLANATGGSAQALHVLQPPPHLPGEPVPPIERARAYGAARDAVESAVAQASNLPAPMPVQFVDGSVATAIVSFVIANKPDLLMLGVAARGRTAGSTPGDTAARILEDVPCDVLIIKPRGFVSPLLTSDES
ncbi:MAG: universal stress protein [Pseudomonadota bacterium]